MFDVKLETEVQKLKKSINYHFIMHNFLLGTLMRNLFFHIVQNELIQILDSVCLLKMMQLCCCYISWKLLTLDSAVHAEYRSREK